MPKLIAIDFDGTIHQYISPWTEAIEIKDPPMPGAFTFILELLDNGFEVAIISSRLRTIYAQHAMSEWMLKYGFPGHRILELQWPSYKPPAFLTIDDRAMRFSGQWPSVKELDAFKPWKITDLKLPNVSKDLDW